jgi:MFS family permease
MSEYTTLLRNNADYRLLWLGSVVSQLGDWFNLIGSATLVARLSGTGTAISYLFLVRFLPLFLFSPLAGILADRYERRQIMIVSDLLRGATVLAFLLVREPGQLWLLYVLTFTQFALSAIFTPARTAVLANVVGREELVPANALDSLTWSTMLAFGALLGGIFTAVLGVAQAFVLDALSFVFSALMISRIAGPIRADRLAAPQGGFLEFLDGLRYLRKQVFILGLALVKAGGALAWGAINVVEITYATEVFHIKLSTGSASFAPSIDSGTVILTLIYFVSGFGTGLGPLVLRRWLGDAPVRQRRAISLGFALMTLGLVLLGAAPTLGLFSLGTLIRTVGSGTIWVFSAALLQMIIPDHFRGRVFAFEFAALTLTQSLSTFWAGVAQDTLGLSVRHISFTMAIVAAIVGISWLIFNAHNVSRPMVLQETQEAT